MPQQLWRVRHHSPFPVTNSGEPVMNMRGVAILMFSLLLPSSLQAEGPIREKHMAAPDPRPQISDYEKREDFVRDILAWKKRNSESARSDAGSADDNTTAEPLDWHHVTGPEDLDTALRNAEGYIQPHYQQPYRFDRTTHISFPLNRLEREQLAEKRVEPPAKGVNASLPPEDLTLKPEQPLITEERLFSENLQKRLSNLAIGQGTSVQTRME